MNPPDFVAEPGGCFQLSADLAQTAGHFVSWEVAKRSGIEASPADRKTWAELFNDTVRPQYGKPHTADQIERLEQELRRFAVRTAANYLQIQKLRDRKKRSVSSGITNVDEEGVGPRGTSACPTGRSTSL